jgi:excisionase family DNA binding protein
MEEKFFTTEQVANILQVHPFTILKYIKQGKLKGIKLGRIYRIKESDIQKFLEERTTISAESAPKEQKEEKQAPEPKKEKNKKDEGDHFYII